MPPAPRRRRRLTKDARREEILEAALTVFERGGYHSTHVDDVIREAKIARGTFYLHFDGKHAVFAALVERMLGIFLGVRPTAPEPEAKSPAAAEAILRASYTTIFQTLREHRRLARLLFEEAVGLDKGFADALGSHYRVWHARVRATLDTFRAGGAVRRDLDTEVTAEMVLGIVERLARRYLFAERGTEIRRLVDAVVAFEMGGIAP